MTNPGPPRFVGEGAGKVRHVMGVARADDQGAITPSLLPLRTRAYCSLLDRFVPPDDPSLAGGVCHGSGRSRPGDGTA